MSRTSRAKATASSAANRERSWRGSAVTSGRCPRAHTTALPGASGAGRWLDLYIAILPYSGEPPLTTLAWEIGLLAGAAGLFALVFFGAFSKAAVIPVGDPFLSESLPAPWRLQESPVKAS